MMGYQHVRFAFDHATNVSGSELLVLVALAEYADESGKCWPSHDSIAARARVSRRQAIRLVQSLVEKGWITVVGRRQYSNEYHVRCDTAMADVTPGSDVTFGAPDVTFSASDVTSSAPRCDIAMSPEPLVEPPIRTTTKNHQGGEGKPKPMPANGPVQELVKAWYERAGGEPVNWGKVMGHGKTLVAAKVTVSELMDFYDWLASDPWWQGKGFDLGTCVSQLEKFRQSKRIPRTTSNGRASPGRVSNYDQSAANIMGDTDDYGAGGPVYETTGRIRE